MGRGWPRAPRGPRRPAPGRVTPTPGWQRWRGAARGAAMGSGATMRSWLSSVRSAIRQGRVGVAGDVAQGLLPDEPPHLAAELESLHVVGLDVVAAQHARDAGGV